MYIAIISFFIWGFFNFYMMQFKNDIEIQNVIFYLYIFALIIMSVYKLFSKEKFSLTLKEKIINSIAGSLQALVYICYFYLLFAFPADSILIVVFYNLFGLLLVLMDSLIFKTKSNLIEFLLFLLICILSVSLIFKTQLLLGKSYDTVSFNAIWGLIPALIAASIGILYKYSTYSYKCTSIRRVIALNLNFLFYRSLGGFLISSILFTIFILSNNLNYEYKVIEVKLGILYAIFPFLISHFFYSLSLYKKASIVILSVFMNISPIVTIVCLYFLSGIVYNVDKSMFLLIFGILFLSSLLTIYHKARISQ